MDLLITLSGEYPALARAEAEALLGRGTLCGSPRVLRIRTRLSAARAARLGRRLAFATLGAQLLFPCSRMHLARRIDSFDWQAHYRTSFAVRTHAYASRPFRSARELAPLIWRRIKSPRVDLAAPATVFHIIAAGNKVFAAKELWHASERFSARTAHKRPGFLPTSLHPKLARACVNLLGPRCHAFTDPFCGAGGFLIEGGLMGLTPRGRDLDARALNLARANLTHFGIIRFSLFRADALRMGRTAFVLTDLPYGRSSAVFGKKRSLYQDFFAALQKNLADRAVVMLPRGAAVPRSARVAAHFDVYVHKSLTRRILVIDAKR